MKSLKLALIVLSAAVLLQTQADAGKGVSNQKVRKAKASAATIWSAYSGVLSGTVLVGSEMVVINQKTVILDSLGNKLEPGASVSRRSLMVSGRMENGKLVAEMIAVGAPVSDKDFSETTLENVIADPNRAR